MKLSLFLFACLLALRPLAHAADAAKGYEKFTFVRTRNVFDPDRRPVAPVQTTTAPRPTSNRPSAVVLTGTLATDGKALAFFASARAEYNKVVPVNETVAGFKVKSISPGIIEVEHEGKTQVLAIGEALPIAGAGPASEAFEPTATPAPAPPDGSTPAAAPDAAAAPASAPAGNGPDDILKRMLERRQKELSR